MGYTDSLKEILEKDFIYCKYKNLTETILNKLGDTNGGVEKESNKIVKVFFYNDSTNPSNFTSKELYRKYFEKLEILSKLKVL
ncbi:hypothetical protein BA768_17315 [Chryseobacterium sp. CBo1]|nr:hypothetical protein BA768_17315 [Chryseobacterium sp. CBo1]